MITFEEYAALPADEQHNLLAEKTDLLQTTASDLDSLRDELQQLRLFACKLHAFNPPTIPLIHDFLNSSLISFVVGTDKLVCDYDSQLVLKLAKGPQPQYPKDLPDQFKFLFEAFFSYYDGFQPFYISPNSGNTYHWVQIQRKLNPHNIYTLDLPNNLTPYLAHLTGGLVKAIYDCYGEQFLAKFSATLGNAGHIDSSNWGLTDSGEPRVFDYGQIKLQ